MALAATKYDPTWINYPKRKFKIYQQVFGIGSKGRWNAMEEYIGSYPNFKSIEEGLEYIQKVLDSNFTGKYGIVVCEN